MHSPKEYLKSIAVGILSFSLLVLSYNIVLAAAWRGPTALPPDQNAPIPINIGISNQVKEGALTVQNSLDTTAINGVTLNEDSGQIDISGEVAAIELCINGDCKSAWPEGVPAILGTPEVDVGLGQGTFRCPTGHAVSGVFKDNSGDSHIRRLKCHPIVNP